MVVNLTIHMIYIRICGNSTSWSYTPYWYMSIQSTLFQLVLIYFQFKSGRTLGPILRLTLFFLKGVCTFDYRWTSFNWILFCLTNMLQTILTRKNTYSGVTYSDEPAIFAWELMNEPRCISNSSGPLLQVNKFSVIFFVFLNRSCYYLAYVCTTCFSQEMGRIP